MRGIALPEEKEKLMGLYRTHLTEIMSDRHVRKLGGEASSMSTDARTMMHMQHSGLWLTVDAMDNAKFKCPRTLD